MRIEWVHPSWRDLVIEHLGTDTRARVRFLSRCSTHGAALAFSVAGGRDGQRQLPLLITDADWDALTDRLYALVEDLDVSDLVTVLSSIDQAIRRSPRDRPNAELLALARSVLERLTSIWDRAAAPVALTALGAWFTLADSLPGEPARPTPPDLSRTWAELLPAATPELADRESTERFADWLALVALLRDSQPTELERLRFPDAYETIGDFVSAVVREPETIHPAGEQHVSSALWLIEALFPELTARYMNVTSRLARSAGVQTAAIEDEPPPVRERVGRRHFDVGRVLQDL